MQAIDRAISLLGMGACLCVSSQSLAAPVTIMGDDLIFTYDDATQFGTANVIGNSIFFLPTNFIAQSINGNNGSNTVVFSDYVDVEIQIKPGSTFLIDGFHLFESGDYKLVGAGTSANAEAALTVDSQTQTCGGATLCSMTNTFSSGALTNQSGNLETWNIHGSLDLDNNVNWADDFHVMLRIENTLYATSTDTGESALVEKKFGTIGVEVMADVPVPPAAWLFGSALVCLLNKKYLKAA